MTFSIPWESLFGGMLLGVSATLMLLLNGKVAGISGILAGILSPKPRDFVWRLLFALGMVSGGVLGVRAFESDIPLQFESNQILLVLAGLLVGLGTRLGNGCTSGHGICGIGRLSIRSIVATGVFMLVAGITVYFRLHLL
ncbi:YeeE/YedE family protein [Vibrio cincinnatiensis]|uniref:YeeE/YedE family protein n=1 Tax=Vibrio cincinnatiensis TaxID=675 RepID=UPI001EE0A964|nr:YeeE/YedE thiosulfate transporter family protein [Vibrio cincinnatiensis]MCG3728346.1 YeeE/YedE family protein [Vibrio cincinnatiensis]